MSAPRSSAAGGLGQVKPRLDGLEILAELGGGDLLGGVGEGVLRVGVSLDQEAIATGTEGGARQGHHELQLAAAVGGVGHDGQVGQALGRGQGAEVQAVAGDGLVGADAALAEDDVLAAVGHEVLGALEPLPRRSSRS